MIKFRNPVSDINIIIKVFKKLYLEFSTVEYFDLDNIAEFLAREKLASSSGYTGDEALKRSYRIPDDSRKSMKMQAKSYTELYRFLGWIYSKENVALNFNFTYLGLHVAVSGEASSDLFSECLLGVNYPNNILNVKFNDINKPFVSMLLFANELGGKIHRDEIILGPMNLKNAYSLNEFNDKLRAILEMRNSNSLTLLNNAIDKVSCENNMKPNSVRNLTRFVISALVFTGWFRKEKINIYGKNKNFLVLTRRGYKIIDQINNSINVNGNKIDELCIDKKIISEMALLNMFMRAGFDVEDEIKKYNTHFEKLYEKYGKKELLFSPYQFFSKDELIDIFPNKILDTTSEKTDTIVDIDILNDIRIYNRLDSFKKNKNGISSIEYKNKNKDLYKILAKANNNIDIATEELIEDVITMKQEKFYPLVANLFSIVFNKKAFAPPSGNNNMRYDVMIPDSEFSIPVEVKSPTEEEMLSVKAIRQATENKILLLSRKPYPTTFETSTLAIGLNIPNSRSDVYKLIDEIYLAYKINVAIMDIKTLIKAAFHCLLTDTFHDISVFENKKGVISFDI